jgi:replication initiation protein RepC
MQPLSQFTAPFGQRRLSLGMLATQAQARALAPKATVDKWKLFRNLCEARAAIGISDRSLVVLNALLTFYPQAELSEANGLIVFPSNAQLSLRAHGMAPATLRRHLSALVKCGLIIRKDSPNGKRYARKARGEATSDAEERQSNTREAFGFNMAPLIARATEIEALAETARAARHQHKCLKERVTLLRRDVDKLIMLGAEELPQHDWQAQYALFRSTIDAIPRNATLDDLELAVDGLECLQIEISKTLETSINSQNISANESHFKRHKQSSKSESNSDLELSFEEKQGQNAAHKTATIEPAVELETKPATKALGRAGEHGIVRTAAGQSEKPVPLGLVLKACPDIADYAKGEIGSWRDLMGAAVLARSILGVSPSAYLDACEVLGQERAAIIVACILQRTEHINSAGGYLRNLTEKARIEAFSVWPMLLAQLRANGGHLAVVE